MCGGSSPSAPPPPPAPPKPLAPKAVTQASTSARGDQRQRALASMGQKGTLLTGGLGLDEKASTQKKKLLSGAS